MTLFLHTKFNPNVIFVNSYDIVLLADKLLYHYRSRDLRIYNRSDIKLTYNSDGTAISIIEYLDVIPITKISIYEDILNYLKKNLQENEYLEFEKFLFDRA